jgi:hypothetical protein
MGAPDIAFCPLVLKRGRWKNGHTSLKNERAQTSKLCLLPLSGEVVHEYYWSLGSWIKRGMVWCGGKGGKKRRPGSPILHYLCHCWHSTSGTLVISRSFLTWVPLPLHSALFQPLLDAGDHNVHSQPIASIPLPELCFSMLMVSTSSPLQVRPDFHLELQPFMASQSARITC